MQDKKADCYQSAFLYTMKVHEESERFFYGASKKLYYLTKMKGYCNLILRQV